MPFEVGHVGDDAVADTETLVLEEEEEEKKEEEEGVDEEDFWDVEELDGDELEVVADDMLVEELELLELDAVGFVLEEELVNDDVDWVVRIDDDEDDDAVGEIVEDELVEDEIVD